MPVNRRFQSNTEPGCNEHAAFRWTAFSATATVSLIQEKRHFPCALRNPPVLPGVLNIMGLHPQIAKFVPQRLCRFCEGLKYPHVFIFLLPTFIIGVALNNYIPHSNEVLTVLGLTMFIASKARWD